MVPRTKKLQREEAESAASQTQPSIAALSPKSFGPTKVRPVLCHNDFVAVLQASIETTIELVNSDGQFKNEGLVIGVGPGVTDGAGGRLGPSVSIGDYVMFGPRNIAAVIEPKDGLYKGKRVVIISERNVICNVPTEAPIEFEIVE